MSLPSTDQLAANPLRFVGMLLAKLGLKQSRVGRAENAHYHVNGDRLQLLNTLLLQRQAGIFGKSIPLDTQSVKVKTFTPLETLTACLHSIKRFFSPPMQGLVLA